MLETPFAFLRGSAAVMHLDVWYSSIDEKDVLSALSPEGRESAERVMAKARTRNHLQVLE